MSDRRRARARLPKPPVETPLRDLVLRIVYLPAAALLWMLRFRFPQVVVPQRIGHLAIEPDCYLKDLALAGERARPILLLAHEEVANQCLVEHWRQHFAVVQNPLLITLLHPLIFWGILRRELRAYTAVIEGTAASYSTYARWGNRAPLLELSPATHAAGRATLARWGLPPDAWFVCVHSREGGYSPEDEHFHIYRNSPITDYIPAMQAIVAAGGWCIRVGDETMQPLPPGLPGVIDYALSADKSEEMDLFLCAECRFLLGNTSGLYLVVAAFGRPCALANATPLSISYGVGLRDIAMPKRLKRDGELIPPSTLLKTSAAHYRYTHLYEEERLELVSNTPEEIRALAQEMIEQVEGRATYTAEDERRQAAYRRLFVNGTHYSYGAVSRVGRDFLRNLDDPELR